LILFSKFCFEIKNNIFKKPNVYVSEKFEIFTLFYIWVSLKDLNFEIFSYLVDFCLKFSSSKENLKFDKKGG